MGIISVIKGWWNNMFKSEIKDKFQVTGITSGAMQDAIQKWMNIYNGEPEWLDPENGIRTINLAVYPIGFCRIYLRRDCETVNTGNRCEL